MVGDGYRNVPDTSVLQDGWSVGLSCSDENGMAVGETQWFTWPAAQAPPLPSGEDLAAVALARLSIPVPAVRIWPPSGQPGLVNLPVVLHVENWAPLEATAGVTVPGGGLSATLTASPRRVYWDMGDGDDETCFDGGTPWVAGADPKDMSCTHTYKRSSGGQPNKTYSARATIVWHLTWVATNGERGDLGEISRTTPFGVQIEELHAVVSG